MALIVIWGGVVAQLSSMAQGGGIEVTDADSTLELSLVSWQNLGALDTRFIIEQANSAKFKDLVALPTLFQALLEEANPRFIVEQANTTRFFDLVVVPAALQTLIDEASIRFIFEGANSSKYTALSYPRTLMNDTTPPIISNVRSDFSNVAGNIDIKWNTNEFASGEVIYGPESGNYPFTATVLHYAKAHTLTLVGLNPPPSGVMYYKVQATDLSDNSIQTTTEYTFSFAANLILSTQVLTFDDQAVGTTSPLQTIIIENRGTTPLVFDAISTTGDYTQSNTCPGKPDILGVGNICIVNVSFMPTAVNNPISGTLTISSNAVDSPHTVALVGSSSQSTLSVSGQVFKPDGSPIAGVMITDGNNYSTTTASDGSYSLTSLSVNEYTLTPIQSGYSFSPTFRTIRVPPDATGQDFIGLTDPYLSVTPSKLRFHVSQGANPSELAFTITNAGSGDLQWVASEDIPWLSLNTTSGLAPGIVTATVDSLNLGVGRYNGQIRLTSSEAVNNPVDLEVTLNVGCQARAPVDIILAVDISGSMRGQPLQDAKVAVNHFIEYMDLSVDQVGLVSFNSSAAINQVLSQDSAAISNTVNSLISGGSTNIAEAIAVSQGELTDIRHNPDNRPVIVLLSDGRQTSSGDPLATANAAKTAGIYLVTIGLGNADTTTLREMASSPGDYYETPSSTELQAIYEQIAVTVGCSALIIEPNQLYFTAIKGNNTILTQSLIIKNAHSDPIDWMLSEDIPWLSLSELNGTTVATLTVSVDPNILDDGVYTGLITATSSEAQNSPQTIQANLRIECGGVTCNSTIYLPIVLK